MVAFRDNFIFEVLERSSFEVKSTLSRADNRNLKPRMEAPEAHVFPTRNKGF